MFRQKQRPYGNRRPFQSLNVSFAVPSKGALPPGPPHGIPLEWETLFLELSSISEVERCSLCQVIKDIIILDVIQANI